MDKKTFWRFEITHTKNETWRVENFKFVTSRALKAGHSEAIQIWVIENVAMKNYSKVYDKTFISYLTVVSSVEIECYCKELQRQEQNLRCKIGFGIDNFYKNGPIP